MPQSSGSAKSCGARFLLSCCCGKLRGYGLVYAFIFGGVVCLHYYRSYRKLHLTKQQAIQAHSVEIEAQDGGGYRVVE